jgi:hypothetical protein
MAQRPSRPSPTEPQPRSAGADLPAEIPAEYAVTRVYVLPAGSAAEFVSELENETEEPTPALRALLRGAAR